jgi:hypothetical protein
MLANHPKKNSDQVFTTVYQQEKEICQFTLGSRKISQIVQKGLIIWLNLLLDDGHIGSITQLKK